MTRYGERCANATHSTTGDEDIAGDFRDGSFYDGSHDCCGWIARCRYVLDVNQRVLGCRR
jgi:hypothetical protein